MDRNNGVVESGIKSPKQYVNRRLVMRKWLTTVMVAAALVWPAALQAQPEPAEVPEPEQPVWKNLDEAQLRALVERQRALAAARGNVALRVEEVNARANEAAAAAHFRVAGRSRTEKAAWMGVQTSAVPQALRQHLKLEHKYVGLLVERVEPESPAEQAGLEQFDIIQRLNDQWIVNTQQFSVLLRMQAPGEEVALSIIRQGQPQEIKVKLVEKELPVIGAQQFEMIELPGVGGGGFFNIAPHGEVRVFRDGGGFDHLMGLQQLRKQENSQLVINDGEHTLKINTRNGQRTLVASDANGVVLFEGPINNETELARVPRELSEKVARMLDMPDAPRPPTAPVQPNE
jgi:hypothetical protein